MLISVKYYKLNTRFFVCYNGAMKGAKVAADYIISHEDRENFKHSSGYAKAQSGDNFGAASIASFETRKALNDARKFVPGYKNSKIGAAKLAEIKPKVYVREEDIIRREPSKTDAAAKPGKYDRTKVDKTTKRY